MESRNTIQRSLVLEAVHKLNHPTADEVYALIAQSHPSISRGTVYRNLGVLVEKGSLRKVPVAEGADRFDFTLEEHYHIRCKLCGLVADVDLPYQRDLAAQIGDAAGFLVEEHDIMLRGICPGCRGAH